MTRQERERIRLAINLRKRELLFADDKPRNRDRCAGCARPLSDIAITHGCRPCRERERARAKRRRELAAAY